jgi:hypothetical protein
MAPEPWPLISHAHLVFDFPRGTITGEDGETIGSLRWSRRPASRIGARDLGYFDAGGNAGWWVRPSGFLAWSPDQVLTPERTVLGEVSAEGLRADGAVLGELEQLRWRFYLPEWRISGDRGWIGGVNLERRWVGGELRRRELWHLRLSPDAEGSVRYLAASTPYLCWRWYHSD